ncbi:hypothetical protein EV641_11179 [Rhodococcus sp. SMB37]|uniref:hypothetical protein n=1 Tax=Rhodococcus sp. SMB37 TaxID=2512213 RepID=UPI0010F182A1|nr:hypothetical protein [Rhodococcus sp. SMB37]TCN50803.1 hypothetical protein EV641_11179 [Rhodococcus sp. SMB37]
MSHYLTRDATAATLRQAAGLAAGSTLAMTFLLPAELIGEIDRAGLETGGKGAEVSGTPFVSFYTPSEILTLAGESGLTQVRHVAGTSLGARYFADRADSLRPSSGEDILVATI